MKKFILLFLCSFFMLMHADSETQRREKKLLQTLKQFPDVMVTFDKHSFRKKDVVKWLLQSHPDFEDYSYNELLDAIERTVDEKIYYTVLSDFLRAEGFQPSQRMTAKYLEDSIKQFPAELRKKKYKNSKIQTLAADNDRQISVALQLYLKKKHPAEIAVNNDEIEYFYRINQPMFMHDAKIDLAFIATAKNSKNARKTIDDAHSMLMQGVRFEKLAEEINSKLPENFFGIETFPPEMIVTAAQMQIDEPSAVLEFPNYYAIIKISSKQPPKYIPLANASFFIKSELESRKSGIYLEKLLNKLLSEAKVKYYFSSR